MPATSLPAAYRTADYERRRADAARVSAAHQDSPSRAAAVTAFAAHAHERWSAEYHHVSPGVPRWERAGRDIPAFAGPVGTQRTTPDGVLEIDIAARSFDQLTPTWQRENLAAGDAAWCATHLAPCDGAPYIHDAWCDRNAAWAAPALLVPYDALPAEERAKDDAHLALMQALVAPIAIPRPIDRRMVRAAPARRG